MRSNKLKNNVDTAEKLDLAEKSDTAEKSNEEVELAETSNKKNSLKNIRNVPADKWKKEMLDKREKYGHKDKKQKIKNKNKEKNTNDDDNEEKQLVVDLLSENSSDDDDVTVKEGKEEGKKNGNDDNIIVNKPSKATGEAREKNSKVIPKTPAKEKSVEKTDFEGTDENKKDTVIDKENIDKNNTGVTPLRLEFNTEFNTGNGTPVSTMSTSTPSTHNIYNQLVQKEAKKKRHEEEKARGKSPHKLAYEDHMKTLEAEKSKK